MFFDVMIKILGNSRLKILGSKNIELSSGKYIASAQSNVVAPLGIGILTVHLKLIVSTSGDGTSPWLTK